MYSLLTLRKSLPLILLIVLSPFSLADDDKKPLSISEIVKIVTDQGYRDIRKIEFSKRENEYEVKARNAEGKKVEIELDASTGKILEIERD